MPIHYSVHPNNLPGRKGYRAIIHFVGSLDEDAIIEQMLRQGSTVTRADILAVLDNYYRAIITLVLAGFKVRTRIALFGASIQGIFTSLADSFDPARHRLEPQISAGPDLRHTVHREGRTVKEETITPEPRPMSYTDINSGSCDDLITPGGMAQVDGHRLKFNPADPEQGLFFIAADETKTRVEVVGKNQPGQLTFLVPAQLGPGVYTLLVRADFRGKLRQGKFQLPLRVL